MRTLVIFLTCLTCSLHIIAQSSPAPTKKYPLARATDMHKCWGSGLFMVGAPFWERNKDEIVKEIGAGEFENLKKHSTDRNLPRGSQLRQFDETKLAKRETNQYYRKLSELVMYKIGEFNDINSGKLAILRVPYEDNKNWDTAGAPKWDTVYFIVDNRYVTEINLSTFNKAEVKSFDEFQKCISRNKDSIASQVGQAEFENILLLSNSKSLQDSKKNSHYTEVLQSPSAQIVGYKIASFTDNDIPFTILRVSHKNNVNAGDEETQHIDYFLVKDRL